MSDLEVDYPRLYWLAFAIAGAATLIRAVVQGLDGVTVQILVLVVAGMAVFGAALRGLRDPEGSGAPTEPTVTLVLAVIAATVYTLFTLATLV